MKLLRRLLLAVLVLFALLQLVPYGRDHANPPVRQEPAWDAPRTRELAARACFDCHSNQTRWPWYSHVAPVSWLVAGDVAEGRREMNFSEWDRPQREAHEAEEKVLGREMPPRNYLLAHPEARLTEEERRELAGGLSATVGPRAEAGGAEEGGGGRGRGRGGRDGG